MLVFKTNEIDVGYYQELLKNYKANALIIPEKNFSGSSQFIEIAIQVTPAILAAIPLILHEVFTHLRSKKSQSEITIQIKSKQGTEFSLKLSSNDDISYINEITDIVTKKIEKLDDNE